MTRQNETRQNRPAGPATPASDPLGTFWALPAEEAFKALESTPEGLSEAEAGDRKRRLSGQTLSKQNVEPAPKLLLRQFASPIVLILIGAALLSAVLGDVGDCLIILGIVVASGLLSFWQEFGAGRAIAHLLGQVAVKANVLRAGQLISVPMDAVVPGDIALLAAGDLVPGDGLLLEALDLAVNEASLTGESFPAEKSALTTSASAALGRRSNALWLGTHVESGTGRVLIVNTGQGTEFGRIGAAAAHREPENSFETGVRQFGAFLARVTGVLVLLIFAVNVLLARPVLDSFLFSLALAVGLTPQLLPAIISVNLSSGARRMAKQSVIVKRLVSIENFGSMDVLCSDKTGTLTEGTVSLHAALSPTGVTDAGLLRLAALNAALQAGFANPIDRALVAAQPGPFPGVQKLDELPYDFTRKRLSVLLQEAGLRTLVCKGAFEKVLEVCTLTGTDQAAAQARFEALSADGFRVLGLAHKTFAGGQITRADEQGLTFAGLLVFDDPLKAGIAATIARLAAVGVQLKVLTGDNAAVAAVVAKRAGLPGGVILTGTVIDDLSADALGERAQQTAVFAELEPRHKERLILALKARGLTVGYLGDGINDVPALRAADVGLSVQGAVDVAKDAADIVLLERDLGVLLGGILEGRRTFANTLKYVYMATSANFGNMFSMAASSLLLPFLPLLPKQVLLINFLTDLPELTLPTDSVNHEMLQTPQRWNLARIRRFMLVFGLISSVFDLLTFGLLRLGLHAEAPELRTGWFVESVVSAALVVLSLRTRRPLIGSRPSPYLLGATLLAATTALLLPYLPFAGSLGFVALPGVFLGWLAGLVLLYVGAVEVAKRLYYRSVSRS